MQDLHRGKQLAFMHFLTLDDMEIDISDMSVGMAKKAAHPSSQVPIWVRRDSFPISIAFSSFIIKDFGFCKIIKILVYSL